MARLIKLGYKPTQVELLPLNIPTPGIALWMPPPLIGEHGILLGQDPNWDPMGGGDPNDPSDIRRGGGGTGGSGGWGARFDPPKGGGGGTGGSGGSGGSGGPGGGIGSGLGWGADSGSEFDGGSGIGFGGIGFDSDPKRGGQSGNSLLGWFGLVDDLGGDVNEPWYPTPFGPLSGLGPGGYDPGGFWNLPDPKLDVPTGGGNIGPAGIGGGLRPENSRPEVLKDNWASRFIGMLNRAFRVSLNAVETALLNALGEVVDSYEDLVNTFRAIATVERHRARRAVPELALLFGMVVNALDFVETFCEYLYEKSGEIKKIGDKIVLVDKVITVLVWMWNFSTKGEEPSWEDIIEFIDDFFPNIYFPEEYRRQLEGDETEARIFFLKSLQDYYIYLNEARGSDKKMDEFLDSYIAYINALKAKWRL